MKKQPTKTAETIRALADKHGVAYAATEIDEWASHITRLAGDDVTLDTIEHLLTALERTGHLTGFVARQLQVNYLREARL